MKLALLLFLAGAVGFAANRAERYVLVLQEPPAASPKGSSLKAARAQGDLRTTLHERNIRVLSANSYLANVVFVSAEPEREGELQTLPGVAYVEKLRPLRLLSARAVDLMKVPAAWGVVNGEQNAGAGVKIGILDTGIDQNHAAFQDGSLQAPDGYPRGDTSYTNGKVIVARSYVSMLAGPASNPALTRPDDLSPRDRTGHGTAVAMLAAGRRTAGPVSAAVGVAPRAWLGNYKIFGSPGVNGLFTSEDVLLRAIEDASTDGMSVIVMALGAPATWGLADRGATCGYPGNDPCNWRAAAIENAAARGMLAVVAAGNSGDAASTYPSSGSVETPGTAPSALTVGATTSSHIYYQTVRVNGGPSNLQQINTRFGDGPQLNAPLTAPVRDIADACNALPGASLSGTVALFERGGCDLTIKVNNAQRAGAIAAIISQASGFQGVFPLQGLGQTGIPVVLIGNQNATALRTYLRSSPDATVTLDPTLREVNSSEFDTIAVFSSRGPSIGENAIKPEVLAVGTDLYVATQSYDPNGSMYSASGYTAIQGTSLAAPLVAGIAALVKQRNPGWDPSQIKSAIVNTADPRAKEDYGSGFVTASVLDQGAGIADAQAAVRTNLTVAPSTLSFGALNTTSISSIPLTLCNGSSGPLALRFQVQPSRSQSTQLSVSNETLTLDPGCRQSAVTIRRSGTIPSPGIYEGVIAITGGAVPLRVPYLYLVGDGIPTSILRLSGDRFVRETGASQELLVKVLDQYGVPVRGASARFQPTLGGGTILASDPATDQLGIAFARIQTGPEYGEQAFYVSIGGNQSFGVYLSGRAQPRPAIGSTGVVNAASGILGRGIAPGSYISIFGRNLSEVTRVFSTPYLPLSLAEVSVSFDVPERNLSLPGRIQFVSESQINVQAPWELQGSSKVTIKVSIGDVSSSLFEVDVRDEAPAAFEYSEAASGRLLAAALDAQFGLITSANGARRGDVVQIYANGLGPVNNAPGSGEASPIQPLATTRNVPGVTIGGRPAEVLFSGLAPQFVGLYQLNVRVPADAATGLQPVVITSNGIESKQFTLPVR